MSTFPVTEKFVSINGEGVRAGELAVFIRFRKCNLSCSYCDTKWANTDSAPAEMLSEKEIYDYIISTGITNVTLTGGEPLLQREIYPLIEMLMKSGRRVEIETNGSIPLDFLASQECRPVFTMDYKLPSSCMESFMCLENFSLLESGDTVKFVSGSIDDLEKCAEITKKYDLTHRCHVYTSPVFGNIKPDEIVEFMKNKKLNDVRLQLQLHKYIWDPEKRGV